MRKHLPADERRAATLDAVIALAAQHDPGEISTAAIAQRMGVTQGALFRHFPTKEAILEAVINRVAEQLLARLDAAGQSATRPAEALRAMFLAHTDFVAEHPGVPRLLFGELQRSGATAPKQVASTLLAEYAERLRQRLQDGCACGAFDAELDLEAAATLFIGSVQGLVMQALIAGDVQRIRRLAPRVFAIYLRGIAPGAAA